MKFQNRTEASTEGQHHIREHEESIKETRGSIRSFRNKLLVYFKTQCIS